MKKSITLLTCSLLVASGSALAERPAMTEGADDIEMIDINEIEDAPVFEEIPELEALEGEPMPVPDAIEDTDEMLAEPEPETTTELEAMPVTEEVSTESVAETATETEIETVETETVADEVVIETQATGDVLEIQQGETMPVNVLDFPRRGMSMDKVRNELGEPVDASDAIGEPPITTWTYPDRTVYFEYSSVVHVVATP